MAQARASSTERVIAAATQVFLEKGFQSSTIDDIARAANISKPTVYQYAPSKQWLFDTIVRLICDVLTDCGAAVAAVDAPAAVRLQWSIQMNIEVAMTYRSSYRLTLGEQTDLSAQARDEFRIWARRTTTDFAELLAACRREGSLDWDGDIMQAANLILSMLNSTYRWFHPTSPRDSAELATRVSTLLSGVFTVPDMTDWPMPDLPGVGTPAVA